MGTPIDMVRRRKFVSYDTFLECVAHIKEYYSIQLKALEERLAEVEARAFVKYCGVYDTDKSYQPGDLVSHSGSLWCALRPTAGVPGSSRDWQLAVKRGDRGRDGAPAPARQEAEHA